MPLRAFRRAADLFDRDADTLVALVVCALCMVLYVATLTPGLAHLGGDGRELTVVAATLGLAHPTGYPLYTWIGHLFTRLVPFGDVAYRMNLMSAFLGAAGVGLLYLVARRLGLRPVIAAFAALLFAVSPTFWSQAVVTEVYAPNVGALALVLWLLLRWAERVDGRWPGADRAFVVFALVYGLSLGMHLSNLAFAPAFAGFVLLTDPTILQRRTTVLMGVLAFLAGTAQFAWLPLRAHVHELFPNVPPDGAAAFYAYTLGAFAKLRFGFPLAKVPDAFATYVAILAENFSVVGLAVGFAGMAALLRRDLRTFWLLFPMYAIHVVYFSQLVVPDPDPFFISSHLVFVLFVGAGLEAGWRAVVPAGAPGGSMAARVGLAIAFVATLAPFAVPSFRMNDQSDDTVVGDFYRAALALLPPGAVLVTRPGAFGSEVAYYHDVLGMRPDLRVADRSWRDLPAGVPVFTIGEERPVGTRVRFPDGASFVPVLRGARHDATLYRVLERQPRMLVDDATPSVRVDRVFVDGTLVGWDAATVTAGRVQLKTYWRAKPGARVLVATQVGDTMLEAHELGFGNPARQPEDGGTFVEELGVVLPAALPAGAHPLRVGVIDVSAGTVRPQWVALGEISAP